MNGMHKSTKIRLSRAISRLRNVLERSLKAQTEGLDVNLHISNEGIFTLNFELRYVVLKLRKNAVFQMKKNVFEEPYLYLEMS